MIETLPTEYLNQVSRHVILSSWSIARQKKILSTKFTLGAVPPLFLDYLLCLGARTIECQQNPSPADSERVLAYESVCSTDSYPCIYVGNTERGSDSNALLFDLPPDMAVPKEVPIRIRKEDFLSTIVFTSPFQLPELRARGLSLFLLNQMLDHFFSNK